MSVADVDATPAAPRATVLQVYRDDGPINVLLGRLGAGFLPPLAGAASAALITALVLVNRAGADEIPPLWFMVILLLATAPSAWDPHRGRLDWLVPTLLRGIEYGYLAVVGFVRDVPAPVIYVLLAVLAYHHYDTVYRTRQKLRPQEWVFRAGLGWEGRLLVVALAGFAGVLPLAYAALAAYLGVLFGAESVTAWARTGRGNGVLVNLEEAEDS